MEKIRSEIENREKVEGICVDEIENFQDFIDETYNYKKGLRFMIPNFQPNREMCKLAKKIIGMIFFAKELDTPRPDLNQMLHFGQLKARGARGKEIPN